MMDCTTNRAAESYIKLHGVKAVVLALGTVDHLRLSALLKHCKDAVVGDGLGLWLTCNEVLDEFLGFVFIQLGEIIGYLLRMVESTSDPC